MQEQELTPTSGEGGFLWLALGCGGLMLVGLCLVPPAFIFLGWQGDDDPVAATPVSAPNPAVEPAAPGPVVNPAPAPTPPPNTGNPAAPPPATGGFTSSRRVTVRITESTGVPSVRVGSTCAFDVTQHPRRDGTFWCRAEVVCSGQRLYGGGQAGYFDCTLYEQPQRHVVGNDFNTTSADTDGSLRLDTLRAELEVRDDASGRLGAFTVRGSVTEVH